MLRLTKPAIAGLWLVRDDGILDGHVRLRGRGEWAELMELFPPAATLVTDCLRNQVVSFRS